MGKKHVIYILILLIVLNIIIRIPTMRNEPGQDTFVIHSLANSISNAGFAAWVNHPLSFFGMYPGSYPSAGPFWLSGFNLLTNLEMDEVILITSIILGLIGFFSAYLAAKGIENNTLFRIFVAFSFSLSPVFLLFTIWSASTRHLFLAIFPLLLWCLFSISNNSNKLKYLLLSGVFFILLGVTHRLFFLMPLIIIAFLSSFILNNLKILVELYGKKINIVPIVWFTVFLIFVGFQIFRIGFYKNIHLIDAYETGFLFTGKEFDSLLKNMAIDYASKIGLLSIFIIIGLIVLTIKPEKKINHIFLLTSLIILSPIISYGTYVPLILLIFSCLLIGLGLLKIMNMIKINKYMTFG